MSKRIEFCYECDPKRKGGYNHKDCRNGKKDRKGKIQKCDCCCQTPGSKVKTKRFKLE